VAGRRVTPRATDQRHGSTPGGGLSPCGPLLAATRITTLEALMAGRFQRGSRAGLSQQILRPIEAKADKVLHTAEITAPVDTGAYKASLKKERIPTGFRISANVHYAYYLEFGTRKMRAYRTLGRALDAAKD
jgi:hypothetical protein